MSSTTPFGSPGNLIGCDPSETPIHARKIVALPRHVREKQLFEQSLEKDNGGLVLNPFRSLVASPTTPDTPTPIPPSGYDSITASFNPSSLSGSTTPELSFSSLSTSSSSPPDSPNPPTPTLSGFTPDQSVDEGNRNDIDPFETPTRADELEKDPSAVVPPVPLMHDVKRLDLRESPSQLNSVEEPVRPSQASADILELGRPISRLEKPFTCGASVSFHDCPREYTPCRKMGTSRSNIGALNAVFVLRSAPQIIEEDSSDEESGPEETGDGDGTAYSFPCGDSEVDELVSKVLSLSLGTGSTVARPTVTPTRVHTRASAFVPARTPPPSPAALSRPVVAHSSTADHPTPMEVDEDVLYPKVMNKGASHPQEISEAAPMDDVVFHPEVRDVEMADAFATNPGAAPFTRGHDGIPSTFPLLGPVSGATLSSKSTPHQAQRAVFGTLSNPSVSSSVPQRTVFDFLCRSPEPTISPGSTVSPLLGSYSLSANSCTR